MEIDDNNRRWGVINYIYNCKRCFTPKSLKSRNMARTEEKMYLCFHSACPFCWYVPAHEYSEIVSCWLRNERNSLDLYFLGIVGTKSFNGMRKLSLNHFKKSFIYIKKFKLVTHKKKLCKMWEIINKLLMTK